MKRSIVLAILAAVFLAGCATSPQIEAQNGIYKGELKNLKLRQNTNTVLTVNDGEAMVEFVDLIEQKNSCKATFVKTNSQIAGTAAYKGNFKGAIGVCRIFAQDPEISRVLHLRSVGNELEVLFSYDDLAKKQIITGYLK